MKTKKRYTIRDPKKKGGIGIVDGVSKMQCLQKLADYEDKESEVREKNLERGLRASNPVYDDAISRMSNDELIGLENFFEFLNDNYKWYEMKGDLSEDFLSGFSQAMNLLHFEIENRKGKKK